MEAIGQDSLNASAILDFFAPLRTYLQGEIAANKETIGWRSRFEEFIDPTDDGNSDPVDNTVPIVVGSVLGALIVAVIIAYFIGRRVSAKKDKKKQERLRQEQLEQGQQRPPVIGGSA